MKLAFEITDPFVEEKLRLQIKIRRDLFVDVMLETEDSLKPDQQVMAELLYEPLNVCIGKFLRWECSPKSVDDNEYGIAATFEQPIDESEHKKDIEIIQEFLQKNKAA